MTLHIIVTWFRRLYHNTFHRWAVVEIEPDGSAQILSTHMLRDVAWGSSYADNHIVIRTDAALDRIERP